MKTLPAIVLMLCIAFCTIEIKAQNDVWEENVEHANNLYEKGNFTEALSLAKKTADNAKSISVQWQSYRIIAMSYLGLNQQDSTRKAVESMLTLNPTYKPSYLDDSKELILLIKSVTVIPRFSVGLAVSAGSNTSFANVLNSYSVSDYNKTYTAQNGFQFGFKISYQLNTHWSADLNLLETQKSYQCNYACYGTNFKMKENLNYLDLPLSMNYYFNPTSRLRFYILGGAYCGILLFTNADYRAENTIENKTLTLNNYSNYDRRNKFNFGAVLGSGITYKVKSGILSLQAAYFNSFRNINKAGTRLDNWTLFDTYLFADDDIRLNNLAISIGYLFHIDYKIVTKKSKQ